MVANSQRLSVHGGRPWVSSVSTPPGHSGRRGDDHISILDLLGAVKYAGFMYVRKQIAGGEHLVMV